MTRQVEQVQRHSWSRAIQTTLAAGGAAAALWGMGFTDTVRAHGDQGKPQQAAPIEPANLQSGMVTSVNSGQIRINETNYPLDAQVTVSDDEGHPRELRTVVPDSHVRFHVRHGHVDQIVVILPK